MFCIINSSVKISPRFWVQNGCKAKIESHDVEWRITFGEVEISKYSLTPVESNKFALYIENYICFTSTTRD
jgi:hypothetical protein